MFPFPLFQFSLILFLTYPKSYLPIGRRSTRGIGANSIEKQERVSGVRLSKILDGRDTTSISFHKFAWYTSAYNANQYFSITTWKTKNKLRQIHYSYKIDQSFAFWQTTKDSQTRAARKYTLEIQIWMHKRVSGKFNNTDLCSWCRSPDVTYLSQVISFWVNTPKKKFPLWTNTTVSRCPKCSGRKIFSVCTKWMVGNTLNIRNSGHPWDRHFVSNSGV